MFFFLLIISLMVSYLFVYTRTPLSLTLLIVSQTILIAFFLILTNLPWFSYILIMVFISGMMIMFLYISCVSSNIYYRPSYKMIMSLMIMTCTALMMMKKTFPHPSSLVMNSLMPIYTNPSSMSVYKTFSEMTFMTSLFMIMYLLLAMISIIKMSYISEGPMTLT